jgi:nicotinate-nucleotide adenylyltransferase
VSDPEGERICLFGGTFDPIHNAHLRIALEALKAMRLTEVLFVPAGHPPHKQLSQITPYEHRFRMVELACQGWPCFVASRLEQGDDLSYSIDSVAKLRQQLQPADRLFFLIGSDAFDEIETWHRWRDLVREVDFIVVSRPGAEFRIAPGARVHRLVGLSLPVSSTDIRDRVAQGKPTPEVPPMVRGYIELHGLYGSPVD